MFIKPLGAENMVFSCDPPNLDKMGKGQKTLLAVKTFAQLPSDKGFPNSISKDIIFMELNKPVLENMLAVC